MRFGRVLAIATLLASTLPVPAASHARRSFSSAHLLHKRTAHSTGKVVGQRTIDDARASEIQTALAGAGYLSSGPSGHWDAETTSAMQRYQADHGWQTKLMPDSRAIIKLGLGPKQTSSPGLALGGSPAVMAGMGSGPSTR